MNPIMCWPIVSMITSVSRLGQFLRSPIRCHSRLGYSPSPSGVNNDAFQSAVTRWSLGRIGRPPRANVQAKLTHLLGHLAVQDLTRDSEEPPKLRIPVLSGYCLQYASGEARSIQAKER
ncbi:hypothetical protein HGRIS_000874 [Hohenbuehelia grisea]|uniref:Uncharacterized protein n=1 Tax=Hohenbuehelia grisea TaxID=104357 RepID=A0ABR3IQ09_9AGAR